MKIGLAAGALAIVCIIGAIGYVWQSKRTPSGSLVKQFVQKNYGDQNQSEVTGISSQITPTGDRQATIHYSANLRLKKPLYALIDPSQFAPEFQGFDSSTVPQIDRILTGRRKERILSLAQISSFSDPLKATPLVKEAVPLGSEHTVQGDLTAERLDDGWHIRAAGVPLYSAAWSGAPKENYGPNVLVSGVPSDVAKLKDVLQHETALLATLNTANQTYHDERKSSLAKALASGTLFAGTASANNSRDIPIFLEIQNLDVVTGRVEAYLRNDGGWSDARHFLGAFTLNDEDDSVIFTLDTQYSDAVRNAGPLVQDANNWRLSLRLNNGHLETMAPAGAWNFALNQLEANEADRQKSAMQATGNSLLAATAPGTLYRGFAVGKNQRIRFEYLLDFETQDGNAKIVSASLELPSSPDKKRPFQGEIIGNQYRAQGWPLVLTTQPGTNIQENHQNSPATFNVGFRILLKQEGDSLVGDSADFTYSFKKLTPEEKAALYGAIDDRKKVVWAFARPGASYDGTLRSNDGQFIERIRLSFDRVEDNGNLVDATLFSLDMPNIYAHLRGSIEAGSGLVHLDRTSSRVNTQGFLHDPLLAIRLGNYGLDFRINDGTAAGRIRNEPWDIQFTFSAATQSSSPQIGVPPDGAPAAAAPAGFPSEIGAYVWIGNQWIPLPRNNGHAVSDVGQQLAGAFFGALTRAQGPQKLADLVFDGNVGVPTCDGSNVRLVYIGPIYPLSGNLVAQYPQLRNYPLMEMAASQRDANGARIANLYRIVPGVAGFAGSRVPATIEPLDPNTTIFTCVRPLPPGSYALTIGTNAFELNLQ